MQVHLFELLGSSEWKWGAAGEWKKYTVYYKKELGVSMF